GAWERGPCNLLIWKLSISQHGNAFMIRNLTCRLASGLIVLTSLAALSAQDSMNPSIADVNKKMVKLFGIGGFKGLPSYGTGILVSENGHILTVNNHIIVNT